MAFKTFVPDHAVSLQEQEQRVFKVVEHSLEVLVHFLENEMAFHDRQRVHRDGSELLGSLFRFYTAGDFGPQSPFKPIPGILDHLSREHSLYHLRTSRRRVELLQTVMYAVGLPVSFFSYGAALFTVFGGYTAMTGLAWYDKLITIAQNCPYPGENLIENRALVREVLHQRADEVHAYFSRLPLTLSQASGTSPAP